MNKPLAALITAALSLTAALASAADKTGEWQVLFDGKETKGLRAFLGEGFPSKGWINDHGAL